MSDKAIAAILDAITVIALLGFFWVTNQHTDKLNTQVTQCQVAQASLAQAKTDAEARAEDAQARADAYAKAKQPVINKIMTAKPDSDDLCKAADDLINTTIKDTE